MEKLQELSQSELQELLENAERVEAMALESDEIQNIQLEREMALAANRSLAEQNLDRKPYLESQKEALVSRYQQLEDVQQTYREHSAQRDGMEGQVSPEALFSRLQVESSKTEEESESLADEFLEGSLALDSFLERFLTLRSLAHKRRVRIEKLQDVLRQRTSSSSSAADQPDPTSSSSSSTSSTSSSTTTSQSTQPQAPALAPAGLPYAPYPVSASNPPSVPANAACSAPYPSAGSSFTPVAGIAAAGSFSGGIHRPAFGPPPPSQAGGGGVIHRPAFGPPPPSQAGGGGVIHRPAFGPPPPSQAGGGACPYPVQPSAFTGQPHPGSAFGQYTPPTPPSSGPAPYPASYSYGGYSYPAAGPYGSTQSPTGRPMYRPGYGVPQPYS